MKRTALVLLFVALIVILGIWFRLRLLAPTQNPGRANTANVTASGVTATETQTGTGTLPNQSPPLLGQTILRSTTRASFLPLAAGLLPGVDGLPSSWMSSWQHGLLPHGTRCGAIRRQPAISRRQVGKSGSRKPTISSMDPFIPPCESSFMTA